MSKRLAKVLRHDPGSVGIALDPNGWVDVGTLLSALAAHGPAVSRAQLGAVVEGNDKRRYVIRVEPDGRERIRAAQGHSVTVDLELETAAPPARLFHGTSAAVLPAIFAEGLIRGARHHVHLSPDILTASAVARRRSGPVAILEVDAARMAAAGHVFYRSANGVWLTDHVPPHFLRETSEIRKTSEIRESNGTNETNGTGGISESPPARSATPPRG